MAPWLIFEWKELKKIYRVFDDLAVGGSCHRFPTYPPIHCSSSLEEMKKRYIYHLSYYYSLVNTQKKLKNKHVQTLTLWNKWNVPVFKKELEGKMSLCRRMRSWSRLLFQVFVTSRPWSLKTASSNREIPRYLLVIGWNLPARTYEKEMQGFRWWGPKWSIMVIAALQDTCKLKTSPKRRWDQSVLVSVTMIRVVLYFPWSFQWAD